MPSLALVFLAGSKGIGGITPVLMADVPLTSVLLLAAFNPATIAVAVYMGRKADQATKLPIAALAGALAGALLIYLGTAMKLPFLATPSRAAGGIFIAGAIFGLAWAALGFWSRSRPRKS